MQNPINIIKKNKIILIIIFLSLLISIKIPILGFLLILSSVVFIVYTYIKSQLLRTVVLTTLILFNLIVGITSLFLAYSNIINNKNDTQSNLTEYQSQANKALYLRDQSISSTPIESGNQLQNSVLTNNDNNFKSSINSLSNNSNIKSTPTFNINYVNSTTNNINNTPQATMTPSSSVLPSSSIIVPTQSPTPTISPTIIITTQAITTTAIITTTPQVTLIPSTTPIVKSTTVISTPPSNNTINSSSSSLSSSPVTSLSNKNVKNNESFPSKVVKAFKSLLHKN